jgi:hypothetical protein
VVNTAASQSTATVTCPAGQVLVGGGAHEYYGGPPVSGAYEPINGLVIKGTVPSDAAGNTTTANDPSSWTAYGGFAGQSENNDLDTAFAMCATGGPAHTVVRVASVNGPNVAATTAPVTVSCPAGTRLVGGGALGFPPNSPSFKPVGSYPSDAAGDVPTAGSANPDSWTAVGEAGGGLIGGLGTNVTSVFALCSTDPSLQTQVAVTAIADHPAGPGNGNPGSDPIATATASCPASTALLDGGALAMGNGPGLDNGPLQQGVHLRGSYPSDASAHPVGDAALNPNSWSSIVQSGGQATPGTDTYAFALCASTAAPTGLLRVTTNPAVPSRISVTPAGSSTPVPMDQWGLNWVKLAPGSYTVSFSDVPGFETPAPQAISITAGTTTVVTGNFTTDGFLRVQLSPAGTDGTISVDGTPRDDYGMWQYLSPGSHQVCFGAVAGFTAPACQNVAVTAGNTTNVTGVYTPSSGTGPGNVGFLRVTTNPAVNARISLLPSGSTTPIPMDQWGLNWVKLAPGSYTLRFSDVPGYETPASQAVTIATGVTTVAAATYTSDGFLRVQLSPAGTVGTISVNGTPRDDYGMWDFLPPATYQVCFGPAPGFATTPPCQNAAVSGGGAQTNVTGVYG